MREHRSLVPEAEGTKLRKVKGHLLVDAVSSTTAVPVEGVDVGGSSTRAELTHLFFVRERMLYFFLRPRRKEAF